MPGRPRFEALEARAVPALVVNPIAAIAGVQANLRIAQFQAGDLTAPVSTTAVVDWGDGRGGTASVVTLQGGGYGVIASTTYPNPGAFAVKVTVTGAADSSKTASGEAVVSPAVGPGNMIPGATSIQAEVGQPFQGAVATFTDPTVGAEAADYSATIQWDGATSPATAGTVTADSGGKFHVDGNYTYATAGTKFVTTTIRRTSDGAVVQTTSTAQVAAAPSLIPSATAIAAEVGRPFQGITATFSDATAGAKAGDYTATVRWDGSTSEAIAATVQEVSPGNFRVQGNYTYETAGAKSVTTRIVRTRDALTFDTTSTAQVAPGLQATAPSPATATSGSPFLGPLLRFGSAPESRKASDYQATIDWGDGATGAGTIVATAGAKAEDPPAYLTVHGTHTYAAPGSYQVTIRVVQAAGGDPMTVTVPMTVYAFNGGLDAGSLVGTSAGVSVTNQAMPVLSGTAEPGAIVALTMRRLGGGDPVGVANVIADASGRWSQTVGPIGGAFLLYGISTPAGGVPSPPTLLNGGRPIAVELNPARILAAGRRPGADRVAVTYSLGDGTTPVGLTSAESYSVRLANGHAVKPASVRISPTRGRSAARSLVLTFPRDTFTRREAATLAVSFAGAQDANGASADPILLPIRLGGR